MKTFLACAIFAALAACTDPPPTPTTQPQTTTQNANLSVTPVANAQVDNAQLGAATPDNSVNPNAKPTPTGMNPTVPAPNPPCTSCPQGAQNAVRPTQ